MFQRDCAERTFLEKAAFILWCVCGVLQRVACEMCKVSAVGQMGVAIVLFQVFLLTVAYVLMDHEACVSFYSVFSFFAGLQVLNLLYSIQPKPGC